MRVIGAGFGRTGTLSLKAALEQLGFAPCLHMVDLIRGGERVEQWRAATEGRAVDWRGLMIGEGWDPLVRFLEVERPDAPFPRLNDTASFREMVGIPAL